ncbi:oligosaccharide flippase family protein [uncultured Chitinophaga sp.]|jgi:Membrane protein involved in the export of O-antigen and teichoic acid|uniref:lipopolysaccharide biosynthesis protein n=1 Tax=uncultured Chitinophaga sp. TaxID=339340 RepID=UPI0026282D0E|nr:oligosaccharide flippase family protein [uncultured Chitinophaga sp.]
MEERGREIIRNTIIYAIGNLGSRVLSFIMVPLYSYYLSKDEFGFYDLVVTTVTLLVPLITMQLSDSIFRWLLDSKDNEELKESVITNAWLLVFFNIVIAALVLLTGLFFGLRQYGVLLVLLATSAILPVIQLSVRGLQENRLFAMSGIIFSAVLLIFNVLLLTVFSMGVTALFISTIFANIAASIFLVYKKNLFRYFKLHRFSIKQIGELLKYSWPLVPNTISWWLISSANKYIILGYLGMDANGIYGVANRFPAIMVMIDSVLIMAWQESAILNFHHKDRDAFFSKVFNKMVIMQLSAALLLALCSKFIIGILISPGFFDAWRYMPILFLAVAFSTFSGFYGTIYLTLKSTRKIFLTTLVAGIINLLVALLLVRYCKLFGVATGTLLGFISLYLIRVFDTRKHLRVSLELKPLMGFLILFVCSFVVLYVYESDLLIWVLLVISLLYTFFINMPMLQQTFGLIKAKLGRS